MEFNQNSQQPPFSGQSYQPPYQQYSSPVNQSKPSGLAIASMILGICSILFSAGFISGLVCAILALVFARKVSKQEYGGYLGTSHNFAKAGKICGIIGLILSILFAILWIVLIVFVVRIFHEVVPFFTNDFSPFSDGFDHIGSSSFLLWR